MLLKDIFTALSTGELEQTNLNPITEAQWPRLVMHLNLALGDLFKRFFLREGKVVIKLIAGQTSYPLDPKYAAASRSTRVAVDDRFILDSTAAPFKNDILKVERVMALTGFEMPMNDNGNVYSLIATDTAPITLQVPADVANQVADLPDEMKTSQLQLIYRARHPRLDAAAVGFDPERYNVLLPDTHLQALLYYVASRVLAPAGLGQAEGVSSVGYWKRYEAECERLTNAGVQISQNAGFDKLRDRGFC